MNIEAELFYDRALVIQGVNSHWRRVVGFKFAFVSMLLIVILLCCGVDSWFAGVAGGMLFCSVALLTAIYLQARHQALSRLQSMGRPSVMFLANEVEFTLRSSLGSSTLPWSAVKSIVRHPDYWLLYVSQAQCITLPLANLSSDSADFIAARVSAAGGSNGV